MTSFHYQFRDGCNRVKGWNQAGTSGKTESAQVCPSHSESKAECSGLNCLNQGVRHTTRMEEDFGAGVRRCEMEDI